MIVGVTGIAENANTTVAISVVIPTFGREHVLVDTVRSVVALRGPLREVIVVDQTACHDHETERALSALASASRIKWLRLREPSITRAMNVGLRSATGNVVLFLDDDIRPEPELLEAHARAQEAGWTVVAGRVLQPWDGDGTDAREGTFASIVPRQETHFMGGNFSIRRSVALAAGGFDENFVHVAYQFEAEFANRLRACGARIFFEPSAAIHHLKSLGGGTRTFGDHLRTARPSHAVGAYYYILRTNEVAPRALRVVRRLLRSIRTRHHLTHPWWIPFTLAAEVTGLFWALRLNRDAPRLLRGVSSAE